MCSLPQDWPALSENVQWAIICDLAHDHQGGIADAVNLLSLNMAEVTEFVNLYLREKARWENRALQDDNAHSAHAFPQRDGPQDEDVQPVLEAEVDDIMRDLEPDNQDVADRATQLANDTEVGPQRLEQVRDIWQESDDELFPEPGNVVSNQRASQPGSQADEVQVFLEGYPPPVELVTDRFSREDIASGRAYLNFVGLQEYADRFSEWFGTGASFREIPGIFDENDDLIFPTEDTNTTLYNGNELGWEGPAPQPLEGPAEREWLMEALPQDAPRPERPDDLELQQFQLLAERINSNPIKPYGSGDMLLNQVPEDAPGGLNRVERDQIGPLAQLIADDEEKGVRADSNVTERSSKSFGQHRKNFVTPGELLKTSSAVPNSPYMPRSANGIICRFPGLGHVNDGGSNKPKSRPPSHSLPSHQPPPVLQPHHGIMQLAASAVPALSRPGFDSSQFTGTGQTTRGQLLFAGGASNRQERGMAKKNKRDAQVAIAQSEVQEAADSGRFSQNGIDAQGFPKCAPCFAGRARCDGGRPCSSCDSKSRRCKDVTKADLDKYPDRAERVIADQAKAVAKAARGEVEVIIRSPALTSNAAVPAVAVSAATATGDKRKHPTISRDTSLGKDDSDLDRYPSEKKDPKDSDYDQTTKKKRPKKGNTPAIKKQADTRGEPTNCTPTKRGSRGPYKKKPKDSAPKSNEPGDEAKSTPTPQPSGHAPSGSTAAAVKARKNPAKAPVAAKNKPSELSQNVDEVDRSRAGAGRRAAAGMTNIRPVPVEKRSESHSVPDPSSSYPSLSGAEGARYLDIPFAPVGTRSRVTPIPVPIAGLPGAYPLQGAYAMPGIPSNVMLSRRHTIAAENNHLSGTEFPSTPSSMHDLTGEGMSVVPQIGRPGLGGSPGPTDLSPTSQSTGSGTTVSMDFVGMPFSPTQGSPAYSHRSHQSMPGRIPQGSPGFSPGFQAGMVSLGSPTVPQRRLSGSSHNNGAHGSDTGVTSPMMAAAPSFALAPGVLSPYGMFTDPRPIPRPVSRLQAGYGYQGPQQSVPPLTASGMYRDHQGEGMRSGSRGVSASPSHRQHTASPRPPMRMADASSNFGQQPARKRPRASGDSLAPPGEAQSWQELARAQWANETEAHEPESPKPSVKPLFGGDASFEVSFSSFSPLRIQEQTDPAVKQTSKARTARPPSASPSKKR